MTTTTEDSDILRRASAHWSARLEAHRSEYGNNGPSIFVVHPELMHEFDLLNALALAEECLRTGQRYDPCISIRNFCGSDGKPLN